MDILVAEDDPPSRAILKMVLEKLGHRVIPCENGRIAWESYQAANFNLLISDWMMPEVDGLELCRAIRALNRKDYCYFILLTAKNAKENLIEGLNAGADDYIIKPVLPDELVARLKVAERILALQNDITRLREILPICAWCKSIRNDEQLWQSVETYVSSHTSIELTHSMCPACLEKHLANAKAAPSEGVS